MSFFKTEGYSKSKCVKTVYGSGKKPNKLKIQQQPQDNIIKNKRNLFKQEKEIESIKERTIRDIKKLFEQENSYYKPLGGVGNFWNKSFEYESNRDRN